MPRTRLLVATSALLALGGTAVAAGGGGGPLPALRGYAVSHGVSPDITERVPAQLRVSATTPRARCAPGSLVETAAQGRVPASDFDSGRAARGYTCNTRAIGHHDSTGGFQVHRYQDRTGRTCAYYDSTLLFPKDYRYGVTGTTVLDMSDPTRPIQTATLRSPAMQTTHESLRVNHLRGLLVANAGSPATQAGFVDVYDVSQDCRHPVLKSSLPLAVLGHEGGFSPDGRTYWASTTAQPGVTAIDVSDPSLPRVVWRSDEITSHGMSLSDDGTRLYTTDMDLPGIRIWDVGAIQRRQAENEPRLISSVTWPDVSIPQNSIPVTISGRKYLVEFDEFARDPLSYDPASPVGAVRVIDVSDERHPRVVSRIRLEVHEPQARAGAQQDDPNAQFGVQGYAAHYCSVPRRVDPGILACSMILSGMRVFDIRDPLRPREVAYFNKPKTADESGTGLEYGGFAMSAPAFDPATRSVWYTDGYTGFWNVQLLNGSWRPTGRYPVGTY